METAIALGALTSVSWGASKYQDKRITANDKKERRERRDHQAEIQRHKLCADFEREKREIAEREYRKAHNRLEVTRLEYYDGFSQQSACADSSGHITCIQPGASVLDPTSNGSSSVLHASGGSFGLSPATCIIAILLTLLLAAIGLFLHTSDQLFRRSKMDLEAKDEKFEQLNSDFTTVICSLDDTKQQLSDSKHMHETSKAHAERLESNLAELSTSLEDTKGHLEDSEKKLHESLENAKRLESDLAQANISLNGTKTQLGDTEKELKENVACVGKLEKNLMEVNSSMEATKKELHDSEKGLEEKATHSEQLEASLVEERNSLESTKKELRDSKQKQDQSLAHAEQLESNLAQAKQSLDNKTTLLQQAERECDIHRTDSETKQTQIQESDMEVTNLRAQLASIQQERNGYRLASGQSAAAIQQLESNLAKVKQSLENTQQELGKVNKELCSVEQKHNDWAVLARRMPAKRCEQIREARLMKKYGALWQLRVRVKTMVPTAESSGDAVDDEDKRDRSEDEDDKDAGDSTEKSNGSLSTTASKDNGSGAQDKKNPEQTADAAAGLSSKPDDEESKPENDDVSSTQSDSQGFTQAPQGDKLEIQDHGNHQKRRKQRGKFTKSNDQQRVAELHRQFAFADWFMSDHEASNEVLDCWVTSWQYKGAKFQDIDYTWANESRAESASQAYPEQNQNNWLRDHLSSARNKIFELGEDVKEERYENQIQNLVSRAQDAEDEAVAAASNHPMPDQ
ncbi:uncharacterized protein MYCFIDRAFT_193510 [Pseudocercospora fijiensis CIRAD86]|uniref:Uncharacterized protein n=1 Tax=Pseudocercospora fijiensis (strain CIRAD86) TaxID=383855 RepID=N1Q9V0_PSEFD|nr:uncharacterized protein MYCFIDRAFT_193510 [Pseudocercospora fijiensis CIRAD86]EME89639.1 hypothetical protein MYCFIDRAFT_193510 [Pseudocercospora fijiensis CIRAD86]